MFDVDTPKDIPPRLQRREQLGAEVAQLRAQLVARWRSTRSSWRRADQLPVLRQQIELLNAKVSEKGAFVRDVREVERELARLKESIALARNPQLAMQADDGRWRHGRWRHGAPGGSCAR